MINQKQVETVSECCSYPLLGGHCSRCFEIVTGVPVVDVSLSTVEREQIMQEYYRENGIDFDDHYDNMEPQECKE